MSLVRKPQHSKRVTEGRKCGGQRRVFAVDLLLVLDGRHCSMSVCWQGRSNAEGESYGATINRNEKMRFSMLVAFPRSMHTSPLLTVTKEKHMASKAGEGGRGAWDHVKVLCQFYYTVRTSRAALFSHCPQTFPFILGFSLSKEFAIL